MAKCEVCWTRLTAVEREALAVASSKLPPTWRVRVSTEPHPLELEVQVVGAGTVTFKGFAAPGSVTHAVQFIESLVPSPTSQG